jgi:hypothetical protein
MARVSHHRTTSDDFFTLPLGLWATQADLGRLTPGGRHVQKRTGLPAAIASIYADVNGLGREISR